MILCQYAESTIRAYIHAVEYFAKYSARPWSGLGESRLIYNAARQMTETDRTPVAPTSETEVLVARIRAGDAEAEELLVSTYRRGVLMIATARTRDREAARDLAQDILIAVLKALRAGRLRDAEKLPAFVQGIARNLVNNYLRERARHPETDLEAAAQHAGDVGEDADTINRRRLLQAELESLSAVDRQILQLSIVEGYSLPEVAQRLGLSHEAVRARKSRVIKRLSSRLKVSQL